MKLRTITAALIISGFIPGVMAQGDLLITPKRVVFSGSKQRETINLVNIGDDTATYSITFVQKVMLEDGSFRTVNKPDSGQMFANPYLQIFPRKVKLAPGEAQAVMLQCRRKSDMIAGEYRSHLFFRAEKNDNPLGMPDNKKDSDRVSVQLVPVYGLSIPVIIQSGEVSLSASINNPRLVKGKDNAYISLTLNRKGNISAYGDLKAEFISDNGKPVIAGAIRGLAVYTTINKRVVEIPINKIDPSLLHNGRLRIQFTSPEGSKFLVYAENEIIIN